jgi:hypothetical protein
MSDAQTWALIVGTLTTQVVVLGFALTYQWRAIKALFDRLDTRIDGVADQVSKLDRDVHAVITRMMGEGR